MKRELAKSWPSARYHQWIEFFADGKRGWAEPEFFVEFSTQVILMECKLTGGILGKIQMEWLYKPLLQAILGKPVRCLLVCKYLTQDTPGPFFNSPEAFFASDEPFGTWHNIG